jgi:phospholipid/cholesterol/gamma-HCH transport system substrate-binding protein
MSDPSPVPQAPPVRHLEFKAALLLVLFAAMVAGTALYLLYARGAFERTQRLVLVAEDAEGVRVGMDLTFAGFPVGRVRTIELGVDGNARIVLDVPRKDAHWLRESSVFTLVRGLVGGATLRAYTGVLTDPPLADGAERKVLIGDTNAELPRVVAAPRASCCRTLTPSPHPSRRWPPAWATCRASPSA